MTRRSFTDEQAAEVVAAYQAGEDGRALAARFGVSHRAIYSAVHRAGVPTRSASEARNPHRRIDPDEVTRLYNGGASVQELARKYKCRTASISAILADREVPLHPGGRMHPTFRAPQEAEVAAAYVAGASLRQLADQHDTSITSIRTVLRRRGIEAKEPARPIFWTEERLELLRTEHASGASESSIAKRLGISTAAVNRRLRSIGATPPPDRARGERHGAWKGGRSRNGDGYVLVRCTDEDRHYVAPNVSGYALEHRLVAGKLLGRKLLRTETVHHINGDKTDNRPTNLQVRHGSHGAGVAFRCQQCGSHDISAVPLAE